MEKLITHRKTQHGDDPAECAQMAELCSKLLAVDPKLRITAAEALQHPFLQSEVGTSSDDDAEVSVGSPTLSVRPITWHRTPARCMFHISHPQIAWGALGHESFPCCPFIVPGTHLIRDLTPLPPPSAARHVSRLLQWPQRRVHRVPPARRWLRVTCGVPNTLPPASPPRRRFRRSRRTGDDGAGQGKGGGRARKGWIPLQARRANAQDHRKVSSCSEGMQPLMRHRL